MLITNSGQLPIFPIIVVSYDIDLPRMLYGRELEIDVVARYDSEYEFEGDFLPVDWRESSYFRSRIDKINCAKHRADLITQYNRLRLARNVDDAAKMLASMHWDTVRLRIFRGQGASDVVDWLKDALDV